MATPFFFSYAHNDALDDHLDTFFKAVSTRVRYLTGAKEDGFRDADELRAGDEWSPALASELRVSPAMVCLYSPSYFQSKVCAQEMQIFLDRRLTYMHENPGKRPANIIPVLWQPSSIPRSLPDFQYEKPRSLDPLNDGVWRVRDLKRHTEFNSIVYAVAARLKEAIKISLPHLPYQPVLGGVDSAFEPPPLPPGEFDLPDAPTGPRCATFVYMSAPAWDVWPFRPQAEALLYISAAVAKGRDLNCRQLTFEPAKADLLERLDAARNNNNLIVVLVDGASLSNAALAARLREFDQKGYDAVSTFVVWPAGHRTGASQQLVRQVFPSLSTKQPPLFYSSIDQPDQFADGMAETLDKLQMAVLKNPRGVTALPPSTTEYYTLPSVFGPGKRQAA